MVQRRKRVVPVRLVEHVEADPEAVARVLRTWAHLLADQAQREVSVELRNAMEGKS